MIDHKISKKQTPAIPGMLPGTEKKEEPPIFMGSCGKIEKTGKITKKVNSTILKGEPTPPQKKMAFFNAKIQQFKNNYEENVISLGIY